MFICALWSPAGKGLTLRCLIVSLPLSHRYPGSGVVLDCIDSWFLHPYLLHQLSETFISECSFDTPINSLWTSFKAKSLSSISKYVPSKMTPSRISQSWCNRTVHRLSRRKHGAFRKAMQNSNSKNWTRYKITQEACKEECKKAYNKYVCDMFNDASICKKLILRQR